MCDYSLMGFPNRLAVAGEELVVHRFPTTSLGLVSPSSLTPAEDSKDRPRGFWSTLKSWFQEAPPVVAVCIPPGSQLLLQDVPSCIQERLRVGSIEEVTFTQTTASANAHRDAIRFGHLDLVWFFLWHISSSSTRPIGFFCAVSREELRRKNSRASTVSLRTGSHGPIRAPRSRTSPPSPRSVR